MSDEGMRTIVQGLFGAKKEVNNNQIPASKEQIEAYEKKYGMYREMARSLGKSNKKEEPKAETEKNQGGLDDQARLILDKWNAEKKNTELQEKVNKLEGDLESRFADIHNKYIDGMEKEEASKLADYGMHLLKALKGEEWL